MNQNKLLAALRARFESPSAMMKKLGLDESLLYGENNEMKRARDQEASTVEEILEMIDQLPEEQRLELLNQLTGTSGEGEDRRGVRGRDRRGARDDPPPFPGRPQTGGGMDPLDNESARRDAQDRRRRVGMDSAAVADFARRFPAAMRIKIV